jgi:U3 small nucleolar RNA-associated protein 13
MITDEAQLFIYKVANVINDMPSLNPVD